MTPRLALGAASLAAPLAASLPRGLPRTGTPDPVPGLEHAADQPHRLDWRPHDDVDDVMVPVRHREPHPPPRTQ